MWLAAAHEILQEFASDLIGVCFALAGGLVTQLRLIARERIPWALIASELLASGLGGFIAHAIAKANLEDPRLIWSTCIVMGLVGATGLRAAVPKFLPWLDTEHETRNHDDKTGDSD